METWHDSITFLCLMREGMELEETSSLVPRLPTPRFYLAAVEKDRFFSIFLHGCEIKSVRGKPVYEARDVV